LKDNYSFHLHIKDIKLYGFHGVYAEEQIVGGWYTVDIAIELPITTEKEMDLSATINYESVVDLVRSEMGKPTHLIEELARKIYLEIGSRYEEIMNLAVRVSKKHPPVNQVAKTQVEMNPNGLKF
jgi:dihydroneopterin aldolase